ncbi:ferredoxin [Streptomyces sp. 846.5]|nr:ferredoxin [Streptomyces sp. 846.5]TDU04837.1 ferredoxin [Streptomyces sp. 846.5]
MHVTVDPSRCSGHALCVMQAPDLFDLDDEDSRARVLADPVPATMAAAAHAAAGGCPERAIAIQDTPPTRTAREEQELG